jgi:hypothetical protein
MPMTSLYRYRYLLVLTVLGCSSVETSRTPLGLGPLALREEERRTQLLSQRSPEPSARDEDTSASGGTPSTASSTSSAAPIASASTTAPTSAPDVASTDATGREDPWPGVYVGTDVTRYVMSGQPDRTFDDPKAKIRVERPSEGQVSFTFIDSSNGQDLCTLQGQTTDTVARLTAGQRCFIEPDDDMSVNSRPGTATLEGKRLRLNVVLDTELEIDDARAEGRIEYEFQGQKQ